ncbi:CbtA family protein [Rhizobiales bacterium]|uniref:CbtA family protein n=1 Tax=Hongsoonwoonella zoysiae TaxID=2821844 RepID=UPI00155F838B|nr:CbtA family protein [Hongsoonwoonella zoysiae]NRG16634.1 CbtA family protein [Hongsoonwoonella zoysiae]
MISRIFGCALGAGCAAGLTLAFLQAVFTAPIILQAEIYETAAASGLFQQAAASANDVGVWLVHDGEAHGGAGDAGGVLGALSGDWAPADGAERTFHTSLTSVLIGFGFALLLLSAMLLSGRKIDPSSGLLWGLGGFAAVALAPSLGLAPELPGSAAADLSGRQAWWIATAIATAAGLRLATAGGPSLVKLAGVALIVAPHVAGAPQPHEYTSTAPAELAGQFAAASLVCAAVFWAVLGSGLGYLWQRRGGFA